MCCVHRSHKRTVMDATAGACHAWVKHAVTLLAFYLLWRTSARAECNPSPVLPLQKSFVNGANLVHKRWMLSLDRLTISKASGSGQMRKRWTRSGITRCDSRHQDDRKIVPSALETLTFDLQDSIGDCGCLRHRYDRKAAL